MIGRKEDLKTPLFTVYIYVLLRCRCAISERKNPFHLIFGDSLPFPLTVKVLEQVTLRVAWMSG